MHVLISSQGVTLLDEAGLAHLTSSGGSTTTSSTSTKKILLSSRRPALEAEVKQSDTATNKMVMLIPKKVRDKKAYRLAVNSCSHW